MVGGRRGSAFTEEGGRRPFRPGLTDETNIQAASSTDSDPAEISPGSPRVSEDEIAEGEALLEALAERIAQEVEAMPRACPWCLAGLANGEAFCNSHCAEEYRRKLLPMRGNERNSMGRPAPVATRRGMALAARAALAKRRWQRKPPASGASA